MNFFIKLTAANFLASVVFLATGTSAMASSKSAGAASCRPGFSFVESIGNLPGFCMSSTAEAPKSFEAAKSSCWSKGARLCTAREWYKACRYSQNSSVFGFGAQAEWVGHRHSTYAEIMGQSSCLWESYGYLEHSYSSRCCYR